jgi:hypothetical protein
LKKRIIKNTENDEIVSTETVRSTMLHPLIDSILHSQIDQNCSNIASDEEKRREGNASSERKENERKMKTK